MGKIWSKHKALWNNKDFLISVASGILFVIVAVLVNHVASIYATEKAGNAVNDLFLSNLPVINVDIIVNEGVIFFTLFIIFLHFLEPKKIPFTLKAVTIFYITRAIFMTLTHLGPFPDRAALDPTDLLYTLNFGGDYFFSGHTGFPFLMALIFWENKMIREACIIVSIVFGGAVILGHLHYSIDVFSAFFISFGIFHVAQKFFAKDFKLFHSE